MDESTPIKAFIIHTPHLDRSEPLRIQLESLGIEFEMVESLSFWLNKEELELLHNGSDFYRATIGRDLSLAEIGGSYGHQLAYTRMVKNRIPWGIIFEDDARLINQSLRLERFQKTKKATHVNLAQFTRTIPHLFQCNSDMIRLLMPSTWAHAYLINLKTAEKLNKLYGQYGITSYPDWPYPQPARVNFFISKIQYFDQELPGSTPTMTDERLKLPMESNEYSLVMPIALNRLIKRVILLRSLDFRFSHIFYHEIFLRIKVRLNRAVRKLLRFLIRGRHLKF